MKLIRQIIFLSILISASFSAFPSFSFEGAGCGQNCASCHSLTNEEAGKMLKIDVSSITNAPAKGLWEIAGFQNGKKVKVYIDYGKKYAIAINAFIPIENIGKPAELRKIDLNLIPLTDALVIGNPSAKKKVIVFTDPDCPYCRKLHGEIKELLKDNTDIVFYIKLFPLIDIHPGSYEKSRSILCKKSLKLLDDAIEGKSLPKAECNTKAVDENIKLAERLSINGTPAIILPDGSLIPRFVDKQTLLKLMEQQ